MNNLSVENLNFENDDENKYIIFSVGGEIFGTKLLSVREVVELPYIKKIPNSVESFIGVCNIRGQIIGVIDFSIRLKMENKHETQPILLIYESNKTIISAKIDKIISVTTLAPENIDLGVNISSMIPGEYILGIGRMNEILVTLINLQEMLSNEELIRINELNENLKGVS